MIINKFALQHIQKTLETGESYTDLFILLGDLNNLIVVSSIRVIENKLKKLGYSKGIITKTKLIGVEMLENMQKHESKEATIPSYFEISLNHSTLKITSGNCVSKADYQFLRNKLEEYNNLSVSGIREKYIDQLKNGILSDKGNAGLGLLTILKRSEKKYDYRMEQINEDEYYFNSNVVLNNIN